MKLIALSLESFRSYPKLSLGFDATDSVTVLLGENATGKTNVLEAVSVLAFLTSPRTTNDADLISWEKEFYRVRGACIRDDGTTHNLEVVYQAAPRKQRACFINGVRTPLQHYIGALPLVTFTPDDLSLFREAPSERRKLIDRLLSQVSPSYLQARMEHDKVLKQRNALLKNIRDGQDRVQSLDLWDERLSSLGALLTVDRLQLFETMQMSILRELKALGEKPSSAEFHYVRKTTGNDPSHIQSELLVLLRESRERDIQILSTSVGPHRDDWMLKVNDRDITSFASRGQERTAVLALLLIQANFLEIRRGEKPVLLLDDVFSELDINHKEALLKTLSHHQVIITTIEMDPSLRNSAHIHYCPLL